MACRRLSKTYYRKLPADLFSILQAGSLCTLSDQTLFIGRQTLVIVFTHKTISWINSQLIIYRMRLDFTHCLVLTNFVVSDVRMPCCKCAENYYIGI